MMRLTLIVSLSAALLATAAMPAAAQSAPTASEGDTDDISQINGIPVKVGEHNEYHYRFKRTNIAINPIGLMMGMYGAAVSYGFHPNIALRVEGTLMKPVGSSATGYELDVGLPVYLRRTYQGPFVELGLMMRQMGTSDGYEDHEGGPQALLGWQWIWDSGLNLAMAFGVGRNVVAATDSDGYHDSDSELFANGYLKVGYAY